MIMWQGKENSDCCHDDLQIEWIISSNLTCSMLTVVNNTILYLKFANKVDVNCSYHPHTKRIAMWDSEYVT